MVSRLKPKPRFYVVGLSVAFLEEFITQGVLKRSLVGWIIPAIIAFLPFLIVVRLLGKRLEKRLIEPKAVLAYYLTAGFIGLMIEWFLIGLSPWSNPAADPLLMVIFQLGIFSFWGGVAFAPKLILDMRDSVARLRRWYKRYLVFGFVCIYLVTFSASRDAKFVAGIGSVLVTFLLLNFFYFKYIRTLGEASGPSSLLS
jgi:hypothetical protein